MGQYISFLFSFCCLYRIQGFIYVYTCVFIQLAKRKENNVALNIVYHEKKKHLVYFIRSYPGLFIVCLFM